MDSLSLNLNTNDPYSTERAIGVAIAVIGTTTLSVVGVSLVKQAIQVIWHATKKTCCKERWVKGIVAEASNAPLCRIKDYEQKLESAHAWLNERIATQPANQQQLKDMNLAVLALVNRINWAKTDLIVVAPKAGRGGITQTIKSFYRSAKNMCANGAVAVGALAGSAVGIAYQGGLYVLNKILYTVLDLGRWLTSTAVNTAEKVNNWADRIGRQLRQWAADRQGAPQGLELQPIPHHGGEGQGNRGRIEDEGLLD